MHHCRYADATPFFALSLLYPPFDRFFRCATFAAVIMRHDTLMPCFTLIFASATLLAADIDYDADAPAPCSLMLLDAAIRRRYRLPCAAVAFAAMLSILAI